LCTGNAEGPVFTRHLQLVGRGLHARALPTQKTEAKVACKIINIMTSLGMPVSQRVA
jgi:hypothetical protein